MANGTSLAVWIQLVYERLVEMGLFKYVLPWLLIFLIVYGVLRKINLFGKEDKEWQEGGPAKLDFMISFVVASLIVAFVPFQTGQFAAFASAYFGSVSVFLIVVLGLILFVGLLTGQSTHSFYDDDSDMTVPMVIGSLIIIFLALASGAFGLFFPAGTAAQVQTTVSQIFINPTTAAILIILTLIILGLILVYWTTAGDSDSG